MTKLPTGLHACPARWSSRCLTRSRCFKVMIQKTNNDKKRHQLRQEWAGVRTVTCRKTSTSNLHIDTSHVFQCVFPSNYTQSTTHLYTTFFSKRLMWRQEMLYPGDLLWCRLAISPIFFAPEESGLCCLILLLGSMSLNLPVHISAQGWCETNHCTNTIQYLILRFEHLIGLKAHVRDNCNYAATYPFPFWPCQTACWPNFLERYLHLR